jgi:hypothetical protein
MIKSHQLSLINSFIFNFLKIMYVCPNDTCWVCAQVSVSLDEDMSFGFFNENVTNFVIKDNYIC